MVQKKMSLPFEARRKRFLKEIKGALAFLPSAPAVIRNHDVHYPFRQDSNLYYLTGFPEAHSFALFCPEIENSFQLFVQPKDKTKELWDGSIIGEKDAKKNFGADEAHSSKEEALFDKIFIEAMAHVDRIYYRMGNSEVWDRRILTLLDRAKKNLGRTGRTLWPVLDPEEILGEMRLVKDATEIASLEQAARISAEGHCEAMRLSKAGMYEYEIEAILSHAFRVRGASRLGYESIVASGANSCVLHYIENSKKMADGELLLIDAGAEYEYYTADITRTFPVSGRFSIEQKQVYETVLDVQKKCIEKVKPGRSIREIHLFAQSALTEGLKSLGILSGKSSDLIKKKAYFPYYPHGTGHYLGMDVHDVGKYYEGEYDTPRKLEPGMVFTVEPGLYFGKEDRSKYKGIGIRIEDDVVVTGTGCKVLTSGVPKEVEELESICSGR